jgi:hypothetical protein
MDEQQSSGNPFHLPVRAAGREKIVERPSVYNPALTLHNLGEFRAEQKPILDRASTSSAYLCLAAQ